MKSIIDMKSIINVESIIDMKSIMNVEFMVSSIVMLNYIMNCVLAIRFKVFSSYVQDNNVNKYFIFIVLIFFMPLLEESFFRLALYKIIEDINVNDYKRVISGIIFSLSHSTNMMVIKEKKMVLYQIYHTLFLGYFLAGLESFYLALLYHCLYNTTLLVSYLYDTFIVGNKEDNLMCNLKFKVGESIELTNSINEICEIKAMYRAKRPEKLKRSYSLDWTKYLESQNEVIDSDVKLPYEFANEKLNEWNDNLRVSFRKYEKIKRKYDENIFLSLLNLT